MAAAVVDPATGFLTVAAVLAAGVTVVFLTVAAVVAFLAGTVLWVGWLVGPPAQTDVPRASMAAIVGSLIDSETVYQEAKTKNSLAGS